MFKKFMVSCLIVCLLCLVVVPVLADGLMVNRVTWLAYSDVSSLVTGLGCGTFYGDNEYLVTVSFYLKDGGVASGYLKAVVWNVTGDAFVENSSNVVSLSDLTDGEGTWCNFTFANTTLLSSTCQYIFGVWSYGGPSSNWYYGVASGEQVFAWDVTDWVVSASGASFMLKVYTTAVSGGGSYTPPDEGSGSGDFDWTSNSSWGAAMNVIVWLIVMFGPALALVYVGLGKWGFITGFTVGAVLAWNFVGLPTWALFGIILVDFGMVAQVAKGGF